MQVNFVESSGATEPNSCKDETAVPIPPQLDQVDYNESAKYTIASSSVYLLKLGGCAANRKAGGCS